MRLEDDRDMKIAGDDFEPVEPRTGEADNGDAALLEQEKENGNLSRARRLGAILAEEVSAVEGDSPTDNSALLTQRRILLAFAVEVGLDALLPNVRDGRQVEERVGETFASLCGKKGDPACEQTGRELFRRFSGQVKRFVDTLEFVCE